MRSSTIFLLATALASLVSGCHLLPGAPTSSSKSSKQTKPRVSKCEIEAGTEPFVFMPYGRYAGTFAHGPVEMALLEDHRFQLRWQNTVTKQEGQWTGRFKWGKSGIGEVLYFCNIQEGINGRRSPGEQESSAAVLGIHKDDHKFKVGVGKLGDVKFVLKPSG